MTIATVMGKLGKYYACHQHFPVYLMNSGDWPVECPVGEGGRGGGIFISCNECSRIIN